MQASTGGNQNWRIWTGWEISMQETAAAKPTTSLSALWKRIKTSSSLPFLFARYASSSAAGSAADYLVFLIAYPLTHLTTASILLGRLASILVTYFLLRRIVFNLRRQFWLTFSKYIALVLFNGLLTSLMVSWLQTHWDFSALLGKVSAEVLLYGVNFFIVKRVFAGKR
jgi:putative flippase GtrA